MVSQRLSLSLPTGPLGLGIQKHEVTGLCFVTSVGNVDVPLQLKDVILSLNGIVLADVDGGVDAVVKLFVAFAPGPRTVVVRRGVATPSAVRAPVAYSIQFAAAVPASTTAPPVPASQSVPASRPASSLTAGAIARMEKDLSKKPWAEVPRAYRAGILNAVAELKDRSGSSLLAIRKKMQSTLPGNKTWKNATYLRELKTLVAEGDLFQFKGKYKLSAVYQAKMRESKQIGKAQKAKDAVATLKKPAPVARASLFPVPAMNGPVNTLFAPYPVAAATVPMPPRVARVSLSPVPANGTVAKKPQVFRGHVDIARKAQMIANAAPSSSSNAKGANASLLKVQQARLSLPAYRAAIIDALRNLPTCEASLSTIKEMAEASMQAKGEEWIAYVFNETLRKMTADGEVIRDKSTRSNGMYWLHPSLSGQRPTTRSGKTQQPTLQQYATNGPTIDTSSVAAHGVSMWKCDFACGAIFPTYEMAGAHELVCEKNPGGNNGASAMNGRTAVVVSVVKPSKESSLGIGIVQEDGSGSVNVSSIASNSLLAGSQLKVGMEILSINGHSCTTLAKAVSLFKAAEGQVMIVAAAPKPLQPVEDGSAALIDWRLEEARMERARIAAGYKLPQP